MMYLFLICRNPAAGLGPDDPPSFQPRHAALGERLRGEGRYVSSGVPLPYDPATVRLQDPKRHGADGAFAETKEAGGYYVVECKDDADAESVAPRIAAASGAWAQIRRPFPQDRA